MPRINTSLSRDTALFIGATALICCAMLILWCGAQIEAYLIRQESMTVVPSDRIGPTREQAIQAIGEAWREENRNGMNLR